MVRQIERGAQPSQGRLSRGFTSNGRTMQHVPNDVLQELQQQRTGEKEADGGGARASREGSAEGAGRPSQTKQASRSVWSEDSVHPTTSSSSSFLGEATGYSRYTRPEIPRRRSGRYPETESSPQTRVAISPPVGPRARSRTTTSSSWPPTAEPVPSQLVGGSAKTDANFLELQLDDYSPTADSEITPRQSPIIEHLRLSPHWTSRQEIDTASMAAPSKNSSPPKTPQSGHSTPSISTQSYSSGKSDASSFAPLLRDNRADKRLLQKKNLPVQHRQTRPPLVKRPSSTRSASFYKPKVVQDFALPVQPAPSPLPISPQSKAPITPLATPTSRPTIWKDRSSHSNSQSQSESSREMALSSALVGRRHSKSRTSPSHSNPAFVLRNSRFETPSESQSYSRDSSQELRSEIPSPRSPDVFSPRPFPNRRNRRPTPPEGEPGTPFDRTPGHGDHYFRTFGPETIYEKAFSESDSATQTEKGQVVQTSEVPGASLPAPKTPIERSVLTKRSHLRKSIFNMFHVTPKNDNLLKEAGDNRSGISSPPQSLSDVKIDTPVPSKSSRKSSPDFFTSYFPIHRRHNKSSDVSAGNSVIGLPTNWEDVVAESQRHFHVTTDNTPMSPLSLPVQPMRPRPKRADERMDVAQAPRQSTGGPTVPAGAGVVPQLEYKPIDRGEDHKDTSTGPGALNWLPSEMKRVNTPPTANVEPTANNTGGFKSFFFDMRSIPTEQSTTESESTEPSKIKRRKGVIPKASLQTILTKLSSKKLKRKATTQDDEQKHSEDALPVTDFQQTPFSQRYGDARRTKMTRIRSYLNEMLKESEDEESMAIFEFDVPDHLPNSPLCPLSPKHTSGGKAICPIHRRKRTVVGLGTNGKTFAKQGKQSPRIVFEGDFQGDIKSMGDMGEFSTKLKDPRV